jgi:dTDP-4-amino-4,6-dideoxygalactose transaminase
MKLSEVQMKKGIKNICTLPKTLVARKENAKIYTEYLMNKDKNHVSFSFFENHSFLKYPLLVKNRAEVFHLAEKHKIALGEWFNSPLHPVQKDFENWQLYPALYPHAVYAGKHIINLPTDIKNTDNVLHFLEQIEQNIIRLL